MWFPLNQGISGASSWCKWHLCARSWHFKLPIQSAFQFCTWTEGPLSPGHQTSVWRVADGQWPTRVTWSLGGFTNVEIGSGRNAGTNGWEGSRFQMYLLLLEGWGIWKALFSFQFLTTRFWWFFQGLGGIVSFIRQTEKVLKVFYVGWFETKDAMVTTTLSSMAVPQGASHFLVYSGNSFGEMTAPFSTAIRDMYAWNLVWENVYWEKSRASCVSGHQFCPWLWMPVGFASPIVLELPRLFYGGKPCFWHPSTGWPQWCEQCTTWLGLQLPVQYGTLPAFGIVSAC